MALLVYPSNGDAALEGAAAWKYFQVFYMIDHILKTPKRVSSLTTLPPIAACKPMPSTLRV